MLRQRSFLLTHCSSKSYSFHWFSEYIIFFKHIVFFVLVIMKVAFIHPDLGIGMLHVCITWQLILTLMLLVPYRRRWKINCRCCCGSSGFGTLCDDIYQLFQQNHAFSECVDGKVKVKVYGDGIIPQHINGRFNIACAILRQIHLVWTLISTKEGNDFDVLSLISCRFVFQFFENISLKLESFLRPLSW